MQSRDVSQEFVCVLTIHHATSLLFVPSNLCYFFLLSIRRLVHEKADDFNRAQRSHQNYQETVDQYAAMTLLGGLKHPIACAVGTIFYFVGAALYQKGYIDTSLDASTARFKKGGPIKYIGLFISLYSTCALAYDLITA